MQHETIDGATVNQDERQLRAEPVTFVSVVIPALNAAKTIEAKLNSLANQGYEGDWEIIVQLMNDSRVTNVDASTCRGYAWPRELDYLTA